MAQGVKRAGPTEPQSKAKKSRTATKKGKRNEEAEVASSPVEGSIVRGGERGEENDGDGGLGAGPQVFQSIEKQLKALKNQQKTQDEWPKEFGQRLDEKEEEVLMMLERFKAKFKNDSSSFEAGLIHLFERALGPIDDDEAGEVPEEPVVHVPFPTIQDQVFTANLSAIVDDCHALTATYHNLANMTPRDSSMQKVEEDLEKDKAAITNSIAAARKVVQRDVEGMLADSFMDVRGRSNLTVDDEARAKVLLMREKKEEGDGVRDSGRVRFGETARAIEKVAEKMDRAGRRRER